MNKAQIISFVQKNNLTSSQSNMAMAMLFSGMKPEEVLKKVKNIASNEILENKKEVRANSLSCPLCGSLMQIVTLADNRKCKYCTKDRVTIPFPKGQ